MDGIHRIYAVHIGKPKVHDYNVGLEFTKALDGVAASRSLTYQMHIRLSIDNSGKTIAQQRMIIHAEDSLEIIKHESEDAGWNAKGWAEDNSQISNGHLVNRRILDNSNEVGTQGAQQTIVLKWQLGDQRCHLTNTVILRSQI